MESVFRYETKVDILGTLAGMVTTPTGFDPAKEKLPVIVYLHGAGERGDGSPEQLQRIAHQTAIPKYFWNNPDYESMRVITIAPQCPENMFWTHLIFPLMKWIREVIEMVNGDEDRISVTGLSMGGYATWDLLCTFPGFFSCAAPVCGGGIPGRAYVLTNENIRVFHAIDDSIVDYKYSLDMVAAARRAGSKVDFVTYDKIDHGAWVPAYAETDLMKWLPEQVRPAKK